MQNTDRKILRRTLLSGATPHAVETGAMVRAVQKTTPSNTGSKRLSTASHKPVVEYPASITSPIPTPTALRPGSKLAMVVTLLTRENGASLADVIAATGWLPHSSRAALTGLRKKGYPVTAVRVEGVTRYHLHGSCDARPNSVGEA